MTMMPATTTRERGRVTRERLVTTAAMLFHQHGVAATGLDAILRAAGAGKSQLYHYFRDKDDLVRAVAAHHRTVLGLLDPGPPLADWAALEAWLDGLIDFLEARDCAGGCPIGTLAAELAEQPGTARDEVADALAVWRERLRSTFADWQSRGLLARDRDPQALADFLLAAKQGGMLLAKTFRDIGPLRRALAEALAHLRYAPPTKAA